MSGTFVCTAGTSIAGGRAFKDDAEDYRRQIRQRLGELLSAHPLESDFLHLASAETNSLESLRATDTDRVVLLSTETPDGIVCAEEVSRLLEDRRGISCEVVKVQGLQVTDSTRFRTTGLQSLFSELDRHCGLPAEDGQDVVLNVTGGFKSVVPYVTLYGLLHQIPVAYLFERSRSHLRLLPVPIAFDYERLGQAMDALALIEREGAIPKEEFFKAIPGLEYHRRQWFGCLIEEDNGLVTFSAFGALLLRQRDQARADVLVGSTARRQYAAASGLVKDQFTFMLERVADPLWRKSKAHAFAGTDLKVFKPGNTSERMACIIKGSRVYVCELLQHDQYEKDLPSRREAQYVLQEFHPWICPTDVAAPPITEEAAYRDLYARTSMAEEQWRKAESEAVRLRADAEAVAAQLRQEQGATQQLRRQLARLQDRILQLEPTASEAIDVRADAATMTVQFHQEQDTTKQLRQQIATLHGQILDLEKELAFARRPWWERWLGRRPPGG